MKVAVVGAGYVGVVTGAGLAALGHTVVCVDLDPDKVKAIAAARAPFFEPGLDEVLARELAAGRLSAFTDLAASLAGSDISIIAVGTPSRAGGIDLADVRGAARAIGALLPSLGRYHVVVVKSTVVPSTTDTVVRQELESASGMDAGPDFGLAMNPEFLSEGRAVEDFTKPDRIVVGALDERTADAMEELYAGFDCPILRTSPRNAEMIKYAANTLFATLISFSNEIAGLCEAIPGLDEEVVMRGLRLDRRWWTPGDRGERVHPGALAYLRAGIGFGGSCFPKDLAAICGFAESRGVAMPVLGAVIEVNGMRASRVVDLLAKRLGPLRDKRVAVLGLAFKPETDDVRESPGVKIVNVLLGRGANVAVHDPIVRMEAVRAGLDGHVTQAKDPVEAASGADALVVATGWDPYRRLDWSRVASAMRTPIILDGRQIVDAARLPAGVTLINIGFGFENEARGAAQAAVSPGIA